MKKPTSRELKYQARVLLDGKYGKMAFITLLMGIFDLGLNYLLAYAFPDLGGGFSQFLYLASNILCNMVYYILLAGLMRIYLHLCRGEKIQTSDLFFFFTDRPEQIALYSIVPFILQNILSAIAGECLSELWNGKISLYPLLLLVVLGVVFFWIQLCFSLVLFLYSDAPWKSALQLMKESWSIMRGNKGRMLYLLLSFLGVTALAVLSLGIGLLFVRPYLYVTQGLFYLNLVSGAEGESAGSQTAF
ncbi:MAG: DUF975 family protein [Lachnospiraceae bacterium]|nr:DUF975 family protein [Lachnospiraceae bacterium]